MKKIFILALVLLMTSVITYAQNTIQEARGKSIGTVVTVKGIVTHGSEWGPIRYFQDNTAGIAAYAAATGPSLNNVNKGDSVTITGTLKNYNGLLELDPLTSVVIRSSGNPVPDPIELTPAQIGETYEGRLVQINNATFTDAGGVFAAGKTYAITANGGSVNIFVNKLSADIIGQPIPNGLVNLTAILSQFTYTSSGGYQLLPRTIADIKKTSSIFLTGSLNNTRFTKSELDFNWTTNLAGTTQMFYGPTLATFKTNITSAGTGGTISHAITLSGITPGQITWVQAFSVNGDTAFSGIMPFATISNSTGNIKAYFNTPVNNSYSTGVNAIYLNQSIDDTLINYINRAKYTIDLAIYNLNNSGISNISTALKAAAGRGVTVRVIGCGTTANLGIKNELAGSAVHILIGPDSPPRNGLMHNKFLLIDTESINPNDPLVWTGSTNFTSQQINLDANNVIIVQDQSLARAYKIEFEEMWGSNGDNADAVKARFGATKKNNTPHEFSINGKRVECYFSPTDGVNAQIVQHIGTTNNDLSIATMLLTRDEIATAIALSKTGNTKVNMLTDVAGNNATSVNTTLIAALGATHYVYYGNSGVMHNKYMIVDQSAPASDPFVFTGSHNWSSAADNDNDENTLIIHDATIANIYYQNFASLFVASNGVLTSAGLNITQVPDNERLMVFPNPAHNGNVNLSYYLTSDKLGTLQLFDITGKMVYNSTLKLNSGDNTMKYNFPSTFKGIYLMRLITPEKVSNKKVIFE